MVQRDNKRTVFNKDKGYSYLEIEKCNYVNKLLLVMMLDAKRFVGREYFEEQERQLNIVPIDNRAIIPYDT